jgi:hypothetical protein
MFVLDGSGKDVRQDDVLDALERNARPRAVIVSSSAVIPSSDVAGANPPHRKAADCYNEIVDDEVICTMSWGGESAPTPVVFTVDEYVAEVTPATALGTQPTRLAAVTKAALRVASQLPTTAVAQPSGPERIRSAIDSDRGGHSAPSGPVGFGR